jgi:hypothetical protein
LTGDGTGAVPDGLIAAAATSTGVGLLAAMTDAWADIGEAGGEPTHMAMSPTDWATEAGAVDVTASICTGRVLQPHGPGRDPRPRTGHAAGHDARTCYLVVARDFKVDPSRDYAPAFKADKVALRVTAAGSALPCQ